MSDRIDLGIDELSRDPLDDLERLAEVNLRPASFEEFIGQKHLKKTLSIYLQAAKKRRSALDHTLFAGPPGLGKTTLAHIVAEELGVKLFVTSGPAIDHRGILAGLLTQMDDGDVLFIDEIHRLSAAVEEYLYPAMEDLVIDVPSGTGAFTQTLRLNLKPFTLIGATTRSGMLTGPLRDRFGIIERLEHYDPMEISQVVTRSAQIIGVPIDSQAAHEIGSRSRGTPRIANRLLKRVRDFADIEGNGEITLDIAKKALAILGVDSLGMDRTDRQLISALIENFSGGPVGLDSIAAALYEDRDTIEHEVEPFLIQSGFLQRTPRGRVVCDKAYQHFGLSRGIQDS